MRIICATNDISLSYHETVFTSCLPSTVTTLVCVASNNDPKRIPITSDETMGSSVYPNDSLADSFMAAFSVSTLTSFSSRVNNSTTEPECTGTRCDEPSSFPCRSGITSPIAFAAPVLKIPVHSFTRSTSSFFQGSLCGFGD